MNSAMRSESTGLDVFWLLLKVRLLLCSSLWLWLVKARESRWLADLDTFSFRRGEAEEHKLIAFVRSNVK